MINSNASAGTTPQPPQANPAPVGLGDHAWTMNAVVQLSNSVARLETSINGLSAQIADLKSSQNDAASRLEKVERKLLVAASIVAIAVAAGGFVANKAIDFGLEMAKAKITEADQPPTGIIRQTYQEPQPQQRLSQPADATTAPANQ